MISDRLVGAIVLTLVVVFVLRYPQQIVRSIRRWGRDEPERVILDRPTFDEVARRMRGLVRPSLLLVGANTPVFSKLGGDPELATELPWPAGERRPLSFLAQFDLAEVQAAAAIDWLPKHGYLYFFFDQDRHVSDDMVRVQHVAAASTGLRPAPKGVWRRFRERRVAFELRRSAPSLDWLGIYASELELSDSEFASLNGIGDTPPTGNIQHRIDGYPDEIQPESMAISCECSFRALDKPNPGAPVPAELEAAADDWRLLLQLDSDSGLKTEWGDGGRLYVFVRAQDARVGDFTRTVTLEHCY